MNELKFIYNGENINILCNLNDKMEDIFKKFIKKAKIEEKSVYYLYNENKIDEKLELRDVIKDKNINEVKIIAKLINELENKNNLIIDSKYIICPECKENIRFTIENYKINLYECKNGHIFNDIIFEEYENLQKINLSEIKCDKCKEKNKGNTHNNEFYRCLDCKMNLCPSCKSLHDKNHNNINYENKNYFCEIHNEQYIEYCNNCKKNICKFCHNEHKKHIITYYDLILPEINILNEKISEIKESIDKFNDFINNLIRKLNKLKEN